MSGSECGAQYPEEPVAVEGGTLCGLPKGHPGFHRWIGQSRLWRRRDDEPQPDHLPLVTGKETRAGDLALIDRFVEGYRGEDSPLGETARAINRVAWDDALADVSLLLIAFAEADHHFDHPGDDDEVAVLAEQWERAIDRIRKVAYALRDGLRNTTIAHATALAEEAIQRRSSGGAPPAGEDTR